MTQRRDWFQKKEGKVEEGEMSQTLSAMLDVEVPQGFETLALA